MWRKTISISEFTLCYFRIKFYEHELLSSWNWIGCDIETKIKETSGTPPYPIHRFPDSILFRRCDAMQCNVMRRRARGEETLKA